MILEKYDINNLIKDEIIVLAHTKEGKSETLKEHSDLTLKYALYIIEAKGFEKNIKDLIKQNLDKNIINIVETTEFLYEMFLLAIYYHDIGKINPQYQFDFHKMNNKDFKFYLKPTNSNHSIYGMYIYNYIAFKEYKNLIKKNNISNSRSILNILFTFGLIISRHHSSLEDLKGKDTFEDLYDNFKDDLDNVELIIKALKEDVFSEMKKDLMVFSSVNTSSFNENTYFLIKLLNSLIISSDYYATYEFMNDDKLEINTMINIDYLFDIYKQNPIYKSITEYKNEKLKYSETDINKLRTEMFIEAEKNIKKDSRFYYLEAPTGSGKTNTSINLALNLIRQNRNLTRIFYVFPFNTLVDQTKEFLEKVAFNDKANIGVINSTIVPKYSEDPNYQKNWNINQLMYNYEIVLTSHVHFFETVLGLGKESQYGFIHLANSVVIIDEIQSYKNLLWDKIITILDMISQLFNIRFIIMSATLPYINKLLLNEHENIVKLIETSDKYYQNPLFKNRVILDFSLLEYENFDLELLSDKVFSVFTDNYKKVLVEFINKKMAREFYKIIKDIDENIIVYELTGNDSAHFRRKMINDIKNNEVDKIILVSTQVIEAGVDIDFDIGFKHYSLLDSEEQFLGRINRSRKKDDSIAYFFKIGDLGIYRNDFRKNHTILDKEYRQVLKNKDFVKYYDDVLFNLKKRSLKLDNKGIDSFYSLMKQLKYKSIRDELKLIDSYKSYTIFINFEYSDDSKKIIGKDVYEKLKNICFSDLDYNVKKYQLQMINELVSIFTFDIIEYSSEGSLVKKPSYFDEEFGGIYYYDNLDHVLVYEKGIIKLDYDIFFNSYFI